MSGKTARALRKQTVKDTSVATYKRRVMSPEKMAEYQADYDAMKPYRADWAEKEKLLLSKLGDSVSEAFNSRVTDSRLSTLVIERAARVMAQIASGTVQALTKKDKGKSALMSLLLTKYIQPNARAQFDHLTKLRLIDLYSQVYGVIPVMYDLSITEKYVGPDCWILPIQTWIPQTGKLSVDDSDHNHVETWVSVSWLKSMSGTGSWFADAIKEIEDRTNEKGGDSKSAQPIQNRTVAQRTREPNVSGGKGDAAQVRLLTRYENGEKGRWITFAPGFDNLIVRDCESKDGHIPIILKHHIPLIDSIYGLGAFERGKSLQYAMDSLVSMYMAGVQMSIFPPRIIQSDGVVRESLDYAPGATWIENVKDSIRNYEVSPQGLQTFQSTYGWLTGSLLNQNGATDTSMTSESASDPSAGKTPQALKLQAARESAADAWDRSMMEVFVQTLYERWINIAPKAPKPFTFHIFDAEIKQIKDAGADDVMDVFESEKAAKITLGTAKLAGCEYRFIIDTGSTIQSDQQAEHQVYSDLFDKFVAAPQLITAIEADGYQVHVGEIARQYVITGGAKDPEKLISKVEQTKPETLPATAGQQPGQAGLPPELAAAMGGQQPPQLPAAAGGGAQPGQLAQIMSGQPAPQPEAPDPSKDPKHQFMLKWFDKLPIPAQRAVIVQLGLPAQGIMPVEAEMIHNMTAKAPAVESPAIAEMHEIDPTSEYGAAKDPHAHLQSSSDPMVKTLYDHIMSSAKPGLPLDATPPIDPTTGRPVEPNMPVAA